MVTRNGVTVNPEKIRVIDKLPQPNWTAAGETLSGSPKEAALSIGAMGISPAGNGKASRDVGL